jgi:purine nucleoside permease
MNAPRLSPKSSHQHSKALSFFCKHRFNSLQSLYEADIWYANDKSPGSIGDLLAQNITVPGLSPLYPNAHCLADGFVCQLTTGESEINAAVSISSLVASGLFDLTTTYFMIAGIAGVNPKYGTLGDVAFCKCPVQVALQYEFDAREIPANFSMGYGPQGSTSPDEYPQSVYGTEVFEVDENLRDIARLSVQHRKKSGQGKTDVTGERPAKRRRGRPRKRP